MSRYLIHSWGGAFKNNFHLKKYEGYYFCEEKEKNKIIKLFKEFETGLVYTITQNPKELQTIAIMNLEYEGTEYYLEYNFGYDYDGESAEFMFCEGNYSCDCNKSIFLKELYGDEFKELDCGEEIKIKDFKIEYRKNIILQTVSR